MPATNGTLRATPIRHNPELDDLFDPKPAGTKPAPSRPDTHRPSPPTPAPTVADLLARLTPQSLPEIDAEADALRKRLEILDGLRDLIRKATGQPKRESPQRSTEHQPRGTGLGKAPARSGGQTKTGRWRLQALRLIADRGPMRLAEIGRELDIPSNTALNVMSKSPWFEKEAGERTSPYSLTAAGREQLARTG